jgi:hypothetical protein
MQLNNQTLFASTLVFFTALCFSFWYCGPSDYDDTYIYMRYVNNFLSGYGMVYNIGEPSHGITSFIWPQIMSFMALIFGNTILVWKFVGAIFFAGGISLIFLALNNSSKLLMRLLVIFPCLVAPFTLRWSSSGMENGIVVFFLGLFVFNWMMLINSLEDESKHRKFAFFLGILSGFLPFVRPELAILSCGTAIYFILERKLFMLYFIPAIVTGLLMVTASMLLIGSIIPQTAAAKSITLEQTDLTYGIRQTFKILFSSSGVALLYLIIQYRILKQYNWLTYSIVAGVVITVIYLGAQNHLVSTRYAVIFSFPIILLFTLHTNYILSLPETKHSHINLTIAAILAQVFLSFAILIYMFPATRIQVGTSIQSIANYVDQKTEQNARIAITEIGAFGFFSRRYIIDLVGLVDKKTLQYYNTYGKFPLNPGNPLFDKLMIERGATHYINTYWHNPRKILGSGKVSYTLLHTDNNIVRNNLSHDKNNLKQTWNLYKVNIKAKDKKYD